jgi:hypothetical protein
MDPPPITLVSPALALLLSRVGERVVGIRELALVPVSGKPVVTHRGAG